MYGLAPCWQSRRAGSRRAARASRMLALRRVCAAGCRARLAPRLHAREVKVNANTLKAGAYLAASNIPGRRPDSIFRLVDSEHVKPGKGGAYVQCKLIDVKTKDIFVNRFNSSDKVEVIELDPVFKAQYLYFADGVYHFMNMETYDTVEVDSQFLTKEGPWLKDGMQVKIRMYEEKAMAVVLPTSAVWTVAETGLGNNNNKSNTNKPAVLENGENIRVPLFVEIGDQVVVRTDDGTYVSKAEKESNYRGPTSRGSTPE